MYENYYFKFIIYVDMESLLEKTDTCHNNPEKSAAKIKKLLGIHKDIFACLFSIHNTISLSCHEQVCLSELRFERYFSHQ